MTEYHASPDVGYCGWGRMTYRACRVQGRASRHRSGRGRLDVAHSVENPVLVGVSPSGQVCCHMWCS